MRHDVKKGGGLSYDGGRIQNLGLKHNEILGMVDVAKLVLMLEFALPFLHHGYLDNWPLDALEVGDVALLVTVFAQWSSLCTLLGDINRSDPVGQGQHLVFLLPEHNGTVEQL